MAERDSTKEDADAPTWSATDPTLDGSDSRRTVRVTFVILAFAAGCILLPPRQWISSIAMFVVTLVLAVKWRQDVVAWLLRSDDPKAAPKKVPKKP